ncbi:integrase [Vibrio cholerae]|uniref:tyrosine-type recombinase/integrase n=1 Tax=Vibrio cholerae TaxID=666 RepID=UPI001A9DEE27|nr:site-specific integrase [Vibrio cholerae]MBO1382123.1 integrase [Vibrio cholerae]MBO1394417.1 integrase [Vibrio cholerae]
MTTIQARKGKKGISYRVQFMRDGQRLSKSFPTKKDAEKFAARWLVDDAFSHSLTNPTLNSFLLSDIIEEFLSQYSGKDVSLSQRVSYWSRVFGELPVGKITRPKVKSELRTLLQQCTPATVNRYKAALGTIYRYLLEEYDIDHNPVRGIPNYAENNERTRFLDDEELPRLLKACTQSGWERLYLLVLLAITTGGRRSELIRCRWESVNFKTRTIHLGTTKNGEQRLLTLTQDVIEELMRFRCSTGYVFPLPKQPDTYFKNFDCYWREATSSAKITNFRFHDLRHTCASILAMNGASLLEICQVLGHKSITMTQRYAHLCVSHKQALTERVFGYVSKINDAKTN